MARERQTAARAIADKAVGYGMPGVQVDGNDVFAVYQATKQAVDLARSGGGPSLIEAVTYRVGPHTGADDPNRYRSAELTEAWRRRDPIERLRRYLHAQGKWDAELQERLEREAAAEIDRAVAAAEALPAFGPGEIFDAVFAQPPRLLAEQRALAEEEA